MFGFLLILPPATTTITIYLPRRERKLAERMFCHLPSRGKFAETFPETFPEECFKMLVQWLETENHKHCMRPFPLIPFTFRSYWDIKNCHVILSELETTWSSYSFFFFFLFNLWGKPCVPSWVTCTIPKQCCLVPGPANSSACNPAPLFHSVAWSHCLYHEWNISIDLTVEGQLET